ncbi:MAG: hypothetical protein AB1431_09725 [Pseudomonadota bacterium]|nr:hypothetical protein [Pseudomonadota bacterium]
MDRREPGKRPAWLKSDNSYDLLVPFEYGIGQDRYAVASLKLRRLTAADMLILDEAIPYTEKLLKIVEAMTGLLRPATLKIDAVDMDRIDDILGYFREPGSATGATSSAS